jgi:non-canonical (house-cleaning) NTP pyrophosphatase
LLETGVIQAKTKHIDVKYHHTRDEIAKGKVEFSYVASAENPADILTKALNAHKHNYILDKLYLKC